MKISVPKDLNSFSVVPAGIYRAAVTGYKCGTSAAGNPKISVEMTIQSDGPNGEKTVGRKVFDNLTLTENALGIVDSKFKALTGDNLPVGDFEIDEFMNMITSRINGREAVIEVTITSGDNGERNNIKKMTAIS